MFDAQSRTDGAAYPPVYRNLMAVGLLGAIYKSREDAGIVCSAVELTLADTTQFRVCRAIALGIGGDAAYASEMLARHAEEHPDDDSTRVAMAVAMMLAGNPDWKSIVDNVLATSSEQTAREAANGVIEYLRNLKT